MSNKYSLIQSIIASLKASVNQFAFRRMTANGSFDAETALQDMKNYGYETLGEYVNLNYFQKLFAPRTI